MSTRCQIEFSSIWENDKKEKQTESILVYRHSNGYPEGVIPDLKSFLKWLGRRIEDVEYTAANFIYWSKRNYEERIYNTEYGGGKYKNGKNKKWSVPQDFNSVLLMGFGICEKDDFHGDIQYFYNVITDLTVNRGMFSKVKTEIKCFKVPFKEGDERLTKKDFKLIKTIKIK
ncbi:hypothetical protein ES695_16280 [Candidatus Atribacteria bacterium 1244-E10-H5-B2]|nr:MAG: hypothetical protein ES695_16280 [Candidatus Atribacteria bacterium 1244-E10-H5-B2]